MPQELPVTGPTPLARERADAARNRQRILDAARELIAARGIDGVCMEEVARQAQVGTGTLYRRFGDRAGLALALLDERERSFQDQLLRGEPPLGPGAAPRERLRAFGAAYLTLVEDHRELLIAAIPNGVLAGGPFDFYRTHLRILLEQAGFSGDTDYVVENLVAMLHPRLSAHLRQARGWSLERLIENWYSLVDAWLGGATASPARTPRSAQSPRS